MRNQLIQTALIGGAGLATAATLLFLAIDPTQAAQRRLDGVEAKVGKNLTIETGRPNKIDVARMAQTPIFVMTTGNSAYKEKTLRLFGVSISPKRKAALLSIDGGPAIWMTAGQASGDIQLLDVGTNGASFDTPLGSRTISLSDPAPANPDPSSSQ